MKVYLLTLLVIVNTIPGESVVFTRCKLVRELLKLKLIEKTFLGSWVCLVEKGSQRDTSAYREISGKKFYGLFQIQDVWCKRGKRGGKCNVACEALLDDDIRDDTECAIKIFKEEGFQYWTQWVKRCKNDNFITNEIYKCPDLSLPYSSKYRTLEEVLKNKKQHDHIATSQSELRNYYGLNWFL